MDKEDCRMWSAPTAASIEASGADATADRTSRAVVARLTKRRSGFSLTVSVACSCNTPSHQSPCALASGCDESSVSDDRATRWSGVRPKEEKGAPGQSASAARVADAAAASACRAPSSGRSARSCSLASSRSPRESRSTCSGDRARDDDKVAAAGEARRCGPPAQSHHSDSLSDSSTCATSSSVRRIVWMARSPIIWIGCTRLCQCQRAQTSQTAAWRDADLLAYTVRQSLTIVTFPGRSVFVFIPKPFVSIDEGEEKSEG
mmetsp:Transcript_9692/g.30742  ORF Transcript_9692/g.30742 Transcript_9692/m.30742 type:complete len:261 (+) Transcript_9692:498-1280(+)